MKHNEDITEALQGQIEGLAQSLLVFGSVLQQKGLVDAQYLQAMLRRRTDALPADLYGLAPAQRLMTHLADELQKVFLQAQNQKKSGHEISSKHPKDTGHPGHHTVRPAGHR